MNVMLRRVRLAALVLALSFAATAGYAQQNPSTSSGRGYPNRPIRLLTPFAPGGGSDILARLIGPQVTEVFGQPIIVDNRPGAGGTVGATIAVRAAPDGYTLILVSGSFGVSAAVHKLSYDSVADITPIILIGTTPLLFAVHPTVPIKSTNDYLAYVRTNPGKLNFGTAGLGDLGHFAGELFKLETKTQFTHVPYKGSGPLMTGIVGGEVQSSISSLVPAIPHVKAGRLRAIAVTTPKRSRALPEVPTIAETVSGFDVTHWYGIWGPKGLPKDIVTRWNQEVAKVIRTEAMQKWLEREGMEAAGGPPEQFLERIKSDVAKWKRVAKASNIVIAQ
jgi:tripartite-type tricarboxylate transporter receptor subunit TctC